MAVTCASCGSADTQSGLGDVTTCTNCGASFDSSGEIVRGADANTRRVLEGALEPRKDTIGGSIADLQRSGAEAAVSDHEGDSWAQLPPGTSAESVETPAEHDERLGLVTRETERTGAADEFREEEFLGSGEKEVQSVDPTSQSPAVVEGTKLQQSDADKAKAKANG